MTSDGAGGSYAYDALNRLTSASGTNSATLVYGPKGRLISTTAGGTTTQFLYDGGALIAEYVSGAVINRYAHGGGVDDPIVWYEGAGTTTKNYLTTDERGSIIGLTDASGANTRINAYDEWGVPEASNIGRFQYTGQIWLHEIGKYYYKARIYDPKLGRFLQTDPIGYDDGMNMYAYVGGDPVNGWDPSGTSSCARVKACDGKGVMEGYTQDTLDELIKLRNLQAQRAIQHHDNLKNSGNATYDNGQGSGTDSGMPASSTGDGKVKCKRTVCAGPGVSLGGGSLTLEACVDCNEGAVRARVAPAAPVPSAGPWGFRPQKPGPTVGIDAYEGNIQTGAKLDNSGASYTISASDLRASTRRLIDSMGNPFKAIPKFFICTSARACSYFYNAPDRNAY